MALSRHAAFGAMEPTSDAVASVVKRPALRSAGLTLRVLDTVLSGGSTRQARVECGGARILCV